MQKDNPEIPINSPRQVSGADPFFLSTEFKIIESYRVLTNVITMMHLDETLARQNGSPDSHWTLNDTFDYLHGCVSVDQTRMTSLIEISVRNQDPKLAADIANTIGDAYKLYRLERWKGPRTSGIEAFDKEMDKAKEQRDSLRNQLADLRIKLNITDLGDRNRGAVGLQSKQLEDWDHLRVNSYAGLLGIQQYSSQLTNSVPTNRLGSVLATAYAHQIDPELSELAIRLQGPRRNGWPSLRASRSF